MRQLLCAAFAVSGIASTACASPQSEARRLDVREHQAVSADRYAVRASYNDGHGYTERARHIADCLATYPSYDHRIDRIRVSRGVTRRCAL